MTRFELKTKLRTFGVNTAIYEGFYFNRTKVVQAPATAYARRKLSASLKTAQADYIARRAKYFLSVRETLERGHLLTDRHGFPKFLDEIQELIRLRCFISAARTALAKRT